METAGKWRFRSALGNKKNSIYRNTRSALGTDVHRRHPVQFHERHSRPSWAGSTFVDSTPSASNRGAPMRIIKRKKMDVGSIWSVIPKNCFLDDPLLKVSLLLDTLSPGPNWGCPWWIRMTRLDYVAETVVLVIGPKSIGCKWKSEPSYCYLSKVIRTSATLPKQKLFFYFNLK